MPSPSSSLSTLRPELAGSFMEFDLEINQRGFVGARVLPVLEVVKKGGSFGRIPVEQLLKEGNTARAAGAGYSRGNWTFEPVSFACEEHGWEEPVDDAEETIYREYFDTEVIATARARNQVLLNGEKRAAAAVFNATTWASFTTGITNEWDDAANATPIDDIEAAAQSVFDQCGLWPNAAIMNRKVFRNGRKADSVIDRLKYQGFQDVRASELTPTALAMLFDLDFVIVAGGARDSALEGQAASFASIWSDEYIMVARVAVTNDIREACIGRTLHYAEDGSEILGTVESYRDEPKRSDIVRVRHDVDELILYAEAGHLLSNATT